MQSFRLGQVTADRSIFPTRDVLPGEKAAQQKGEKAYREYGSRWGCRKLASFDVSQRCQEHFDALVYTNSATPQGCLWWYLVPWPLAKLCAQRLHLWHAHGLCLPLFTACMALFWYIWQQHEHSFLRLSICAHHPSCFSA